MEEWIKLGLNGGGLAALVVLVRWFLIHMRESHQDYSATIKDINDRNLSHHEKLARESAERTASMRECMAETNKTLIRCSATLDRHESILSEYERQNRQRSGT